MQFLLNVSNGFIGFTGRIEQAPYRIRFIVMLVINFIATFLIPARGWYKSGMGELMALILLVSSVCLISLVARRLRDLGKSAWWIALIGPCVLVLYIVGIIFCFKPGNAKNG